MRGLPIKWYGTKYNKFSFIDEHLPGGEELILPFGGSGITMFRLRGSGDRFEEYVWNDVDEYLYDFMWCVREDAERLQSVCRSVPFAKESILTAKSMLEGDDRFVRAGGLFMLLDLTRNGVEYSSARVSDFSRSSRRRKANENRIERLSRVGELLDDVELCNRDFRDVLGFAGGDSVVYADPPYPSVVRSSVDNYRYEFDGHLDLIEELNGLECPWVVSSYANELYRDGLDWDRVEVSESVIQTGKGGDVSSVERSEVLYISEGSTE